MTKRVAEGELSAFDRASYLASLYLQDLAQMAIWLNDQGFRTRNTKKLLWAGR